MMSSHATPPRRRILAPSATALALASSLVLAVPAAAQDTAKPANADSAAQAAAQAAAKAEACTKLKTYAKQVANDSIKAMWKAGTLFSATDSTSRQIRPQMPRLTFDSATVPDSMRTVAVTAGASCRAAPNSQALQQMVQTVLGSPRPVIGVQFQGLTASDTAGLGLSSARGLLIQAATPGFGAAAVGLQKGDVIISVNGESMGSPNQFMQRASQWKDGQVIKLEVVHQGGKRETLNVTTKMSK